MKYFLINGVILLTLLQLAQGINLLPLIIGRFNEAFQKLKNYEVEDIPDYRGGVSLEQHNCIDNAIDEFQAIVKVGLDSINNFRKVSRSALDLQNTCITLALIEQIICQSSFRQTMAIELTRLSVGVTTAAAESKRQQVDNLKDEMEKCLLGKSNDIDVTEIPMIFN